MKPLLTLIAFTSFSLFASHQRGTGKQLIDFSGVDEAKAIEITSDGRLVIAGDIGRSHTFAVTRTLPNGNADTSFNWGGKNMTSFHRRSGMVDVKVSDYNEVVTAGFVRDGEVSSVAMVKYEANGKVDYNFGSDGQLIDRVLANSVVREIALDKGKILAAGTSDEGSFLYKYDSSGQLDLKFASGGRRFFSKDVLDKAYSIILDPAGRILLGGYSVENNLAGLGFVRLLSNGEFDKTLNGKGYTHWVLPNRHATLARKVLWDDKGRIYGAGYFYRASRFENFVARFTNEGKLDETFNEKGYIDWRYWTLDEGALDMEIDKKGRIIVLSFVYDGKGFVFGLARFNPDGKWDKTFHSTGRFTFGVSRSENYEGGKMALRADGSVCVAAGSEEVKSNLFNMATYCFKENGDPDTNYGSSPLP